MGLKLKAPNVYDHTDYRSFLLAFVQSRKLQRPSWSLSRWAQTLGLKATTSITMVLNGQRQPGKKLSQSLVDYFQFDPEERAYFLSLIALAKAAPHSHLKNVLKREVLSRSKRKCEEPIPPQVFAQIANWQSVVIRQIARCGRLTGDLSKLNRALVLPVPDTVLRATLRTLLDVGLLRIDANQTFQPSERPLTTENDVAREAYKVFHEQMISLAKSSLRTVPVSDREITSLTLPVAKANLPRAKELIRRFVDEFDALMEDTTGDGVYQLNVQFFPVAVFAPDQPTETDTDEVTRLRSN